MFLFRLALALGYASPDRLANELMPEEVDEWLAYYWLEPFGDEVRSAAMQTAATINAVPQILYGRAGKRVPQAAMISEDQILGGPTWLRAKVAKRYMSDDESQAKMCRGLDQ